MKRATIWATLALLVYFSVQLAGLKSIGLTDDDDFYIPAGIAYASWIGRALKLEDSAWSRQGIDAAFQHNKEHPPFAKYVFGICHFAFSGILGPTDSARVGAVLFSTLIAFLMLAACLFHLGPSRGLLTGIFSVLMLLTLPRFYFHSHAGTLDVPVAAMYLATVVLLLFAERKLWAAIAAGPVFGLAAATKLNAPFILLAYIPFVIITRYKARQLPNRDQGFRLPSIPIALASMAILGPITFFAVWPWMWFDTVLRVTEYVKFHLNHYGIHFLYFGTVYTSDPFAPWHAPFVMTLVTVPIATTVLALSGLAKGVVRSFARAFDEGPDWRQRREDDFLLMISLNAFTTVATVAFAGTPIYGGEKLFMPFFPLWCLLAGYGATWVVESVARTIESVRGRQLAVGLAALVSASGALLGFRFGEYGLSEYNGLIGGLRGATAEGFERQYYDVAFRDLVKWLSDEAPPNVRVHFLPNNWEYVRTYKWYRDAGELRQDIVVVRDERAADWIVLTHERRFARYGDDLMRYRNKKVLKEKRIDSTPIWTVLDAR